MFVVTFAVTFAASLAIVGALLVRLPATYFLDRHERALWIDRHPLVRWSGIIVKNGLGVALIMVGGLLSLPGIPGQGLLTILLGVMLLDYPGKRRLERRLIGMPRVLERVNRLRARFGKPPLILAEANSEAAEAGPGD
ncbi:MAG: hypothetical protein GX575_06875 [Candidatus Anammoximicrobium sp.]|nr:hypothetical protein [Candidatus Anammoximicrobium sp.]